MEHCEVFCRDFLDTLIGWAVKSARFQTLNSLNLTMSFFVNLVSWHVTIFSIHFFSTQWIWQVILMTGTSSSRCQRPASEFLFGATNAKVSHLYLKNRLNPAEKLVRMKRRSSYLVVRNHKDLLLSTTGYFEHGPRGTAVDSVWHHAWKTNSMRKCFMPHQHSEHLRVQRKWLVGRFRIRTGRFFFIHLSHSFIQIPLFLDVEATLLDREFGDRYQLEVIPQFFTTFRIFSARDRLYQKKSILDLNR